MPPVSQHYHVYKLEANLCIESDHLDPMDAFHYWLHTERDEGFQALVTPSSGGVFAVGVKPEPIQRNNREDPFLGAAGGAQSC